MYIQWLWWCGRCPAFARLGDAHVLRVARRVWILPNRERGRYAWGGGADAVAPPAPRSVRILPTWEAPPAVMRCARRRLSLALLSGCRAAWRACRAGWPACRVQGTVEPVRMCGAARRRFVTPLRIETRECGRGHVRHCGSSSLACGSMPMGQSRRARSSPVHGAGVSARQSAGLPGWEGRCVRSNSERLRLKTLAGMWASSNSGSSEAERHHPAGQ